MPGVITVTWNGTAYKVDRPGWDGGKVLTLDQIEEWLVPELEHMREYWNGSPNERAMQDALEHIDEKLSDLLAQVQAWRGGK